MSPFYSKLSILITKVFSTTIDKISQISNLHREISELLALCADDKYSQSFFY